jgi:hypothetical protein
MMRTHSSPRTAFKSWVPSVAVRMKRIHSTLVFCFAACAMVALPLSLSAASTVLLGDQAVESTRDSNSAGMAEAFQAIATKSGMVSALTLYVDSSNKARTIVVGLYSGASGSPSTLLGQATLNSFTAGTWNTVSISPVTVTAGTVYWIAVLGTGGAVGFRDGGTNCVSSTSTQTGLTTLPQSWIAGTLWPSCRLSAYGSGGATGPILSLSQSTVSLSATQGSGSNPTTFVNVSNTGTGGLSFTVSSDSPWLTATPTAGIAPQTLKISAAVGSMQASTYTGHVTITSLGTQGSPATITATFTVASPPPVLSLSATNLSFSAIEGSGTNPAPAPVNVTNAGGGTLGFTATSNSAWLKVTPSSGTAPETVQVSAALGALAVGTYNGSITVTATGAQGSPATIPVSFAVVLPPVSFVIGDPATEATPYNVSGGQALATQAVAASTAPVTSFSVYLDGSFTASHIVAGLYSDNGGTPGTLLGYGSNSSTLQAGAWNSIPISTANIISGSSYWIALLGSSDGNAVYRAAATSTCNSQTSQQTSLSALPSSWTAGPFGPVCPLSAYGVSDPSALTFNISGTISGTAGATPVDLTGTTTAATITDGSGNYLFTGLVNGGSYTVTPVGTGFTYMPASQTVTISGANMTLNFSAAIQVAPAFSISGTISPASNGGGLPATVVLSGPGSAATATDSSGNYSFLGLAGGAYVVTPSNSGYSFSPPSQTVPLTDASATGINFTTSVAATSYSISGKITPSSTGAGSGATITLSGLASGSTTAASDGTYSFAGLQAGRYVVTPSAPGASFNSASSNVTIRTSNVSGVNFTASTIIFYDNFAGTSLSSSWYAMNEFGDTSNSELQCYLPSQVAVNDMLTITTAATSVTCGTGNTPSSYASGRLVWANPISFTYGTVEYKVKFPGGSGTWPAVWLLGHDCQPISSIESGVQTEIDANTCKWPGIGSNEIDITEIKEGDFTRPWQNVVNPAGSWITCQPSITDVTQNFHVYDFSWTNTSLTWSVDGVQTCQVRNSSYIPSTPMFLIINTAVGGSGGGQVSGSTLPQNMYVDYVKVTQP